MSKCSNPFARFSNWINTAQGGNQGQSNGSNEQINALLAQAAPQILCGPECQARKLTESLRQKYIDAQQNLQTAPRQVYDTRKDYLVNVDGLGSYNSTMSSSYTREANSIVTGAQTEFNDNVEEIKNMITTYNILYINVEKLTEYLITLNEENAVLQKQIEEAKSDIITNNRKSYYESQGYDVLVTWFYVYCAIYLILLVVFLLGIFLSPTSYSYAAKFAILIIFAGYPFIVPYLMPLLFYTILNIYNKIGKNVLVSDKSTSQTKYNTNIGSIDVIQSIM
jgi:hypothetical protein